MRKLVFYVVVAALMALGFVWFHVTNAPYQVANSSAAKYVECAAYYRATVEVLHRDQDEEVALEYEQRASMALEMGAELEKVPASKILADSEILTKRMVSEVDAGRSNLEQLGDRYGEPCVELLDD